MPSGPIFLSVRDRRYAAMQLTPLSCPGCNRPLSISWDMWGEYYVCEDCGFTAEDDDDLSPAKHMGGKQLAAFLGVRAASGFTSAPHLH